MAIADIFDGLDKIRDAIRQMIRNEEIPIVKLFGWLLPGRWSGSRSYPDTVMDGSGRPPRVLD